MPSAMTLPKDAELLGADDGELEIKGAGAHTVVRLNPDIHRSLATDPAKTSGDTARDRFYLILENIRGTHDATVLNVYINFPEAASPGDHRNLLVGSVGLYGLRRASIRHGEEAGMGLTSVLDITRILIEPPVAKSTPANEIRVSIVPHRQLPDSAGIVVGRVSIYRQRH
jgi:tyrosinase